MISKQFIAQKTLYRGVVFKSALEARWARLFDERGITWEYEPIKVLPINGSPYTFDFSLFINGKKYFIEVKPTWSKWLEANSQKFSLWQAIKVLLNQGVGTECFLLFTGYPEKEPEYKFLLDRCDDFLYSSTLDKIFNK